ncbi:MAG: PRC-barrel domain-containing protein [archaeon]
MATIMKISEMYDKDVFTDAGAYFGKVSDVVLGKFMIHGWVIKSTPQSMLRESLSNVRAVIVPHKAVRAIGDIVIISQNIELGRAQEDVSDDSAEGGHGEESLSQMPQVPQAPAPASQPPMGGYPRSPFRF